MSSDHGARNRWLGGAIVAVLGLLGAVYLGIGARRATLDTAVQAVAVRTQSAQAASGSGLQTIVRDLVASPANDLAFVTIRAADRTTVASSGDWSDLFEGWVAPATAHSWRAWLYRTLCAETQRPLSSGMRVHLGVTWLRVLVSAGPAFWLTVLLMVFGVIVCVRDRRVARVTGNEPRHATTKPGRVGHRRINLSFPAWRDSPWLAQLRPGWRESREAPVSAAGFQPIGRPAARRQREPSTPQQDSPAGPVPAPLPVEPGAQGPEAVAPEDSGADTAAPPAASAHDRYVLRFQPVWRGALDGLLAGAVVRLAHAGDETAGIITLDAFLTSGRGGGDADALVQWLLRRLIALQANWRTLELPRVPLMLVLPDALFAPSGTSGWIQTLAQQQAAAGDLIVCVARVPSAVSLPVRWAVAESERRESPGWYRLAAGSEDGLDVDTPAGAVTRFALPPAEAGATGAQALSPRAFARLMSRSELAPL